MAIALATLDTNGITTETESDFTDELTESSENLFLRNLSQIIANSEQSSAAAAATENQLCITEVVQSPQPQFGYFLPISFTPKLRPKWLKFNYETLVGDLLKNTMLLFPQGYTWIEPFTNTTQPTKSPSTFKC